jgi:hypothetical protein
MVRRCHHKNDRNYHRYGAIGVTVCTSWISNFEAFLNDMGIAPQNHSLDRHPNPFGNYEPGNCRWATSKEQMRNRRNNVLVMVDGRTQCLTAWIEELGLQNQAEAIKSRYLRGWNAKEMFGLQPRTPKNKRMIVNFGGKEQHVKFWLERFKLHQMEAACVWPASVKCKPK